MTDNVRSQLRELCAVMDERQGPLTVEVVMAQRRATPERPTTVEMLPDLDAPSEELRASPNPRSRWASIALAAAVVIGIAAVAVTDGPIADETSDDTPASSMTDPEQAEFSVDPVSGHRWFRVFPVDRGLVGSRMTSVAVGEAGFVALGVMEHDDDSDARDNLVWTSGDGITWLPVDEADGDVFDGATMHDITGGGPGFVAVGALDGSAAVWTSANGLGWTRAGAGSDAFDGAAMHALTAGGPGLVAVGGEVSPDDADGADGASAVVWTSTDGVQWTRVPHDDTVFGGSGAQVALDVTAGGPGLVAVGGDFFGYSDDANQLGPLAWPAIWVSVDGLAWSRVAEGSAPLIDEFDDEQGVASGWLTSVAAGNPGVFAIVTDGTDSSGGGRAWTSVDGLTWSRVPPPDSEADLPGGDHLRPNQEGSLFFDIQDVAGGPDGMVTVGARVHRSIEGEFWSRLRQHPVFTGGNLVSVVAGGPGFVAVGSAKTEHVLGAPFAAAWVAVPDD